MIEPILNIRAPEAGVLRVRLVSADPLVRTALAPLLREGGADVDVEASTRPSSSAPDVVLWDASAPEPRPTGRGAPILALVPDGDAADAAWRGGAAGVLARDVDAERLLAALAAVAHGLAVLDETLASALRPDPRPAVPEGEMLTPREREVLTLLAEGLPNKLIADRLGISERTARYHVAQILARLGAQSRTEAVVLGARLGLVVL